MNRPRCVFCAVAIAMVSLFALVTPVGGQQCLRQMNIPEWQEDEASGARFVAVADGYAFLISCDYDTEEGALRIIDVRTPSEPVEVGSLEMCARDLVVSGRYAYANSWVRAAPSNGAFVIRVIDVSDPASPIEVALIEGVGRIAAVADGYGYTFDPDVGIWVLDLTDPSSPIEVGFLRSDQVHYSSRDLAISGNYAYVAAGGTGHHYPTYLRVVDVSDPAWPVPVALVQINDGNAVSVAVSGHYAYVGSGFPWSGNVTVIDVSNPAEPEVVAQSDRMGFPSALAVAGRLLYVNTYEEWGGSPLVVYDVSDPTRLVEVDHRHEAHFRVGGDVVPREFNFSGLCLCGRYVYAVSSRGDFVVFDSWSCSHPYYRYPIAPPQIE